MINTITSLRAASCKHRRSDAPAAALLTALAEPLNRLAARGLAHLSDAVLRDIGLSRMELTQAL
jgi:uncharacterized protein YjiS (DUF1127 family)